MQKNKTKKLSKKSQALVKVRKSPWMVGDEKNIYAEICRGSLKDPKDAEILRRLYNTSDRMKILDDMVALRYFIVKFLAGDSDIEDPAAAAFAFIQAHRALASYWNMIYRFEKSIDADKLNEIQFSLKTICTEVSGVLSISDLDEGELPDEATIIEGQ